MSKHTTLSLCIAALAASPVALSADKSVLNKKVLKEKVIDEEVITVASHQPLSAEKVGSAITVIDQAYLQQRKPLQIVDILRDVPGLAVSASGVRGSQTDLRVRGAESNHVLVLLDGIEINDAAQGDAFNWAHLTSADVARIEIIRGPQSALWGSEAVAGVISITSRRAAEGKLETRLFSEAGSFASRHVGASVASAGDRYHYRLSADRLSTDGDNISRQGDERDGYRNYNIHLNSGYQLSDNAELSAVARQTVARNQFDGVSFSTGLPEDAANFTDTRQKYFRLLGDVSLLDGNLKQRYAFSQSKHDNANFSAFG
ncbi:MAG: TonB-dependent receptor plug domain-containing protein, partial [Porticoccaceae bacterium]|nr:TonB-dependent receptor plug domain-containing protein [Porticoccaceae bacterium]